MTRKFAAIILLCVFCVHSSEEAVYMALNNREMPEHASVMYFPEGVIEEEYKGTGNQLVYCISNAHCNREAQENISAIIKQLKKRHGNDLKVVGVEGTSGEIDTRFVAKIPDKKIKKQIVDELLEEGKITGPELYTIEHKEDVKLHGIEDFELYVNNFKHLYEGLQYRKEAEKVLSSIREAVEKEKKRVYSSELKEFEKKENEYRDGKIGIERYIEKIIRCWTGFVTPSARSFLKNEGTENADGVTNPVQQGVQGNKGSHGSAPRVSFPRKRESSSLSFEKLSQNDDKKLKTFGSYKRNSSEKAKWTRFLDSRLRGVLPLRGDDTDGDKKSTVSGLWSIVSSNYPELSKKLKLYKTLKKTNKKQVMLEARYSARLLKDYLNKEEIKKLKKYRQEPEIYYEYLALLLKNKNIRLPRNCTALESYLKYIQEEKQINHIKLRKEIDEASYAIKNAMVGKNKVRANPCVRPSSVCNKNVGALRLKVGESSLRVVYLDRYTRLLEKYIKGEVNIYEEEEWRKERKMFWENLIDKFPFRWTGFVTPSVRSFPKNEGTENADGVRDPVQRGTCRFPIDISSQNDIHILQQTEKTMKLFYDDVYKRNEIMVQNLLKQILQTGDHRPETTDQRKKTELGRRKKSKNNRPKTKDSRWTGFVTPSIRSFPKNEETENADGVTNPVQQQGVSIMIAGGFHTKGITEILRNKGISYVVIRPNVKTRVVANGRSPLLHRNLYIKRVKEQAQMLGMHQTNKILLQNTMPSMLEFISFFSSQNVLQQDQVIGKALTRFVTASRGNETGIRDFLEAMKRSISHRLKGFVVHKEKKGEKDIVSVMVHIDNRTLFLKFKKEKKKQWIMVEEKSNGVINELDDRVRKYFNLIDDVLKIAEDSEDTDSISKFFFSDGMLNLFFCLNNEYVVSIEDMPKPFLNESKKYSDVLKGYGIEAVQKAYDGMCSIGNKVFAKRLCFYRNDDKKYLQGYNANFLLQCIKYTIQETKQKNIRTEFISIFCKSKNQLEITIPALEELLSRIIRIYNGDKKRIEGFLASMKDVWVDKYSDVIVQVMHAQNREISYIMIRFENKDIEYLTGVFKKTKTGCKISNEKWLKYINAGLITLKDYMTLREFVTTHKLDKNSENCLVQSLNDISDLKMWEKLRLHYKRCGVENMKELFCFLDKKVLRVFYILYPNIGGKIRVVSQYFLSPSILAIMLRLIPRTETTFRYAKGKIGNLFCQEFGLMAIYEKDIVEFIVTERAKQKIGDIISHGKFNFMRKSLTQAVPIVCIENGSGENAIKWPVFDDRDAKDRAEMFCFVLRYAVEVVKHLMLQNIQNVQILSPYADFKVLYREPIDQKIINPATVKIIGDLALLLNKMEEEGIGKDIKNIESLIVFIKSKIASNTDTIRIEAGEEPVIRYIERYIKKFLPHILFIPKFRKCFAEKEKKKQREFLQRVLLELVRSCSGYREKVSESLFILEQVFNGVFQVDGVGQEQGKSLIYILLTINGNTEKFKIDTNGHQEQIITDEEKQKKKKRKKKKRKKNQNQKQKEDKEGKEKPIEELFLPSNMQEKAKQYVALFPDPSDAEYEKKIQFLTAPYMLCVVFGLVTNVSIFEYNIPFSMDDVKSIFEKLGIKVYPSQYERLINFENSSCKKTKTDHIEGQPRLLIKRTDVSNDKAWFDATGFPKQEYDSLLSNIMDTIKAAAKETKREAILDRDYFFVMKYKDPLFYGDIDKKTFMLISRLQAALIKRREEGIGKVYSVDDLVGRLIVEVEAAFKITIGEEQKPSRDYIKIYTVWFFPLIYSIANLMHLFFVVDSNQQAKGFSDIMKGVSNCLEKNTKAIKDFLRQVKVTADITFRENPIKFFVFTEGVLNNIIIKIRRQCPLVFSFIPQKHKKKIDKYINFFRSSNKTLQQFLLSPCVISVFLGLAPSFFTAGEIPFSGEKNKGEFDEFKQLAGLFGVTITGNKTLTNENYPKSSIKTSAYFIIKDEFGVVRVPVLSENNKETTTADNVLGSYEQFVKYIKQKCQKLDPKLFQIGYEVGYKEPFHNARVSTKTTIAISYVSVFLNDMKKNCVPSDIKSMDDLIDKVLEHVNSQTYPLGTGEMHLSKEYLKEYIGNFFPDLKVFQDEKDAEKHGERKDPEKKKKRKKKKKPGAFVRRANKDGFTKEQKKQRRKENIKQGLQKLERLLEKLYAQYRNVKAENEVLKSIKWHVVDILILTTSTNLLEKNNKELAEKLRNLGIQREEKEFEEQKGKLEQGQGDSVFCLFSGIKLTVQ